MPSVTLSTSRRRTAQTMPSALAPSSTSGADPTIATRSPNKATTIALTTEATTTATQAPHNRACTFDERGSGSTRSSHDNTGSTISSGTSPATTAHGELMAIASSINTVKTPHTSTGGLSQRGNRGLRATCSADPTDPSEANAVHDVPSYQRQVRSPNGSRYQPAGARAESAVGRRQRRPRRRLVAVAHAHPPTNARMWNSIWSAPYARLDTDRTGPTGGTAIVEAVGVGTGTNMGAAGVRVVTARRECIDRTRAETRLIGARRARRHGGADFGQSGHRLGEQEGSSVGVPQAELTVDQQPDRRLPDIVGTLRPALERLERFVAGVHERRAERLGDRGQRRPRPVVERVGTADVVRRRSRGHIAPPMLPTITTHPHRSPVGHRQRISRDRRRIRLWRPCRSARSAAATSR